jgi:phytoene synthase
MRCCDDISDGKAEVDQKREKLCSLRSLLDAQTTDGYPDFDFLPAFNDAVHRFGIPSKYFHWIIDGVEMDLTIHRYETFEELYRYCFNVASSVGLVSLHIFGYEDERAKEYAELCGVAFQLTNILRDLKEDAHLGRIYLPAEDLKRFHYTPEDLRSEVMDDRFSRLMTYQANRATKYYTAARRLLPLVDKISRPALWAMMEIYGRILKKIIRRGYDVFGTSVCLSGPEKASIALKAITMKYLPWARGLE